MCSKEVLQASIDERSRNFGMCRKEMLQASIDERSCNFGMCRKQLLQASIDERSGTCPGPMLWQRLETLCVQRGIRKSVPSGLATKPQLLEKLRKNIRPLPKKADLIQQCKEMNLPVHTSTGVSGRLLSSQELFDMSHRWKGVSPASRHESSDKAANTNTRYVEAFGGLSL